jgi:hypothetical protein
MLCALVVVEAVVVEVQQQVLRIEWVVLEEEEVR